MPGVAAGRAETAWCAVGAIGSAGLGWSAVGVIGSAGLGWSAVGVIASNLMSRISSQEGVSNQSPVPKKAVAIMAATTPCEIRKGRVLTDRVATFLLGISDREVTAFE